MKRTHWTSMIAAACLGATLTLAAPTARACGGFFCSASPVDQNAERIVFAIDEAAGTTDMIVQIAYQGADEAFAWVLPVGAVPQNRAVFPNGALTLTRTTAARWHRGVAARDSAPGPSC